MGRCASTSRSTALLARHPRRGAADELSYAWHEHGFALYSMRSERVSRLYLRVRTAAERRQGVGWGTVFPPSWREYGNTRRV